MSGPSTLELAGAGPVSGGSGRVDATPRPTGLSGQGLLALDRQESRVRQWVAWAMIVCGLIGAYGVLWDIQWHVDVGRDRFLTPPHLTLYVSTSVRGLICLSMVLWSTWRYRQGTPELNERTTVQFLGFRGPLGVMVAGFGDVTLAASAPLDNYWHQLYGIDVSIWEPFHMMGLFGNTISIFGLFILLSSEFNRAVRRGELSAPLGGFAPVMRTRETAPTAGVTSDSTWRHPTQLALACGFLVALSVLMIVLLPAAQGSKIVGHLFGVSLFIYPILLGILMPMGLSLAGFIMQSRYAATSVAVLMLAWRQLAIYTVPLVVEALRQSEGLPYRPGTPVEFLMSRYLPPTILLGGIAVDWYRAWYRKQQQRPPGSTVWPEQPSGALMGLLATFPVMFTWWPYLMVSGSRSEAARKALASLPTTTATSMLLGLLISMGVGMLMARFAQPLNRVLR